MNNWQEEARHLASKIEHAVDRGRLKIKQKFNLLDDITILPYRGYGNTDTLRVRGRVLENEGLDIPPEDASLWDNIKTIYHRYESDEVPGAPLQYTYQGQEGKLETDEEGYFDASIPNSAGLRGWQKVKFTLLKQYKKDQPKVEVEGEVLLPNPNSSFGVLSDLDDTVIISQATNFFEKSRILLLNNERTRKPFAGVAAFYQALQQGADGKRENPFFYISSSSWNLYDMFKHFCELNNIPKGVFLLRDVGLDKQKFYRTSHEEHKLDKINNVLESFPDLSFILIGDSGQKDPEIYQEVVQQNPGRILCVYIRDVNPEKNSKRDGSVKAIADKVQAQGVPMLLVQHSLEAAQHAVAQGWIPAASLSSIEDNVKEDNSQQEDVRQTLGLHKIFG